MAKMNSKFKYMFDAAPSIALGANDGVAITSTTQGPAYALDQLDGYWNIEGELADQTFAVVVNVEALGTANGDEVYAFALEFGSDSGFGDGSDAQVLEVTQPGQYVFLVDIDTLKACNAGLSHIRVTAALAGTGPTVTYKAWNAGAIIR